MHNRLRHHLASGKLDRYQKASNMSLMDWDDELAYLAELNVKQCVMEHDECRSTGCFELESTFKKLVNVLLYRFSEIFLGWAEFGKPLSIPKTGNV